jgi:hypothetical protein
MVEPVASGVELKRLVGWVHFWLALALPDAKFASRFSARCELLRI